MEEQQARQECLPLIRLTVNNGNRHAVDLYERYVFETVEKVKSDIDHGYVMKDFTMVKKL